MTPPPLARPLLGLGLVVAAVTMLGIPAHATYGARVTADEPQYLLTAISLGEDLDLDIADEIARGAYRPFHRVDLDRQTEPTDDGREVSPHDPLLPAVLAVPMRLGGWVAAKAALALCAGALASLTAWMAVRRFGVAPRWALGTVGAFALSTPLGMYATQVYPELPAALVVVAAVAALTGPLSRRGLVGLAVAVTALVWLSVKYAPVAAALVLVALVRLGTRRRRTALALLGALAVQAGLYLVVHRVVYGGWTVYASGDHFVATGEFSVVGVDPDYVGRTRRLIGLLVDEQFGLAAWMPAWLLAPPALGALARRRPAGWLALVVPAVAGWAVATWVALTMHGWWWPGRQVVVIVPLLVVVVAWWGEQVPRVLPALVAGAVLGIGSWVWTLVEAITRRRTLVVDFMETANPWYRLWHHVLPDGAHPGVGDDALTGLWIAFVLALAVAAWRTASRPVDRQNSVSPGSAVPRSSARSTSMHSMPRPSAYTRAWGLIRVATRTPRVGASRGSRSRRSW
jgi:hypothetical protein